MTFSKVESIACAPLVEWALKEDLGPHGDLTSHATVSAEIHGRAAFVARSSGIVAGLDAAYLVFTSLGDKLFAFENVVEDGASVSPGSHLAVVAGKMRSLLTMERTALNFLQRLSGIATLTRKYVDAVEGTGVKILDTRKTTPGWRLLEKYAVRCGGGHNHRTGLYDGILIKDNHLAALGGGRSAVRKAIQLAREHAPEGVFVEVEVDDLAQLEAALEERPDYILLDNMDLDTLREAVTRRSRVAPEVELEASGGVTLDTVRAIAETGVDRISVGALTHSAPALDIALDYLS